MWGPSLRLCHAATATDGATAGAGASAVLREGVAALLTWHCCLGTCNVGGNCSECGMLGLAGLQVNLGLGCRDAACLICM